MLRSVVESLTKSWRFQRTLRIGSKRIPIIVSPSAGLRYLFKPLRMADPKLVALAQQYVKVGDVVWDIGANIGLFSFAAAAIAGPSGVVYSFEPDTWLIQLLGDSAGRQPATSASVRSIAAAVAGQTGVRLFSIAKRSRSGNFLEEYRELVPFRTGGAAETQHVIAISLDWAAQHLPPPNVLKIDVEGAEHEVLAGAAALLHRVRPIVICEVFEQSSRDVSHLLHAHGYKLLDGDNGKEVPEAPWSTIGIPS